MSHIHDLCNSLWDFLFPAQVAFLSMPFSTVNIYWNFSPEWIQRPYTGTPSAGTSRGMRRLRTLRLIREQYKLLPWMSTSMQMVIIDTVLEYARRDYELGISYRPEGWHSTYNLLHAFGCINLPSDLNRLRMFAQDESGRLPYDVYNNYFFIERKILNNARYWIQRYETKHDGYMDIASVLERATSVENAMERYRRTHDSLPGANRLVRNRR